MKNNIKDKNNAFFYIDNDSNEKDKSPILAPHTLTPEEVLNNNEGRKIIRNSHKALDLLKKRVTGAIDEVKEQAKFEVFEENSSVSEDKPNEESSNNVSSSNDTENVEVKDTDTQSLLDKCKHFLVEDDGTKVSPNNEPLYKLQSVAEILKSNGEKFLEKLSEEYDVFFDDLSPNVKNTQKQTENKLDLEKNKEEKPKKITPEPKIEIKEESSDNTPKYENKFEDKILISDIDAPTSNIVNENKEIDSNVTITFTPVSENGTDKKINVSTFTRPIDFTGEFSEIPNVNAEQFSEEIELEENDFQEYIPEEEINTNKDAQLFLRKYSLKKRKSFISISISVLTCILLLLTWIPVLQRLIIANNLTAMLICSSLTLVSILFNLDCFKGLLNLFSKDCNYDVAVSFSVLTTFAYSIFGILASENIVPMLLCLNLVLAYRSFGIFMWSSVMILNLKIMTNQSQKNTVKLINDSAITFNMAEKMIDGDALIACTQPTDTLTDFMKHSTFGKYLDGNTPYITIVSIILSTIIGIICGIYFDGVSYGFYASSVIFLLTALPVSFLIDNLPLYCAAKKLSSSGAMILGMYGAEQIEQANATVINANRIFPEGSVTLHQMQALSANNLEDTIVRAASLTEALGSTLAPIFKTIAGTGNITALPDSDTVKYEDKMGISGWVDNRLLFIGNRTLLETHGISVPSLEVDKKILRQGYFPVYVATQNKACALIIIQYNVKEEIANELRRITDSGVDLLVSSSDPNLTEEMICDYFGLYNDSVKVLTAAGRHTHRNISAAAKSVSAPAVAGRNPIGIVKVLNTASKIKKSNMLLVFSYILSLVLGTVVFAYASLGGSGNLLGSTTFLLYFVVSTIISYLLYLFKKP